MKTMPCRKTPIPFTPKFAQGLQSLDDISLPPVFARSVPKMLKGAYIAAIRLSMEEIFAGKILTTRSWRGARMDFVFPPSPNAPLPTRAHIVRFGAQHHFSKNDQ